MMLSLRYVRVNANGRSVWQDAPSTPSITSFGESSPDLNRRLILQCRSYLLQRRGQYFVNASELLDLVLTCLMRTAVPFFSFIDSDLEQRGSAKDLLCNLRVRRLMYGNRLKLFDYLPIKHDPRVNGGGGVSKRLRALYRFDQFFQKPLSFIKYFSDCVNGIRVSLVAFHSSKQLSLHRLVLADSERSPDGGYRTDRLYPCSHVAKSLVSPGDITESREDTRSHQAVACDSQFPFAICFHGVFVFCSNGGRNPTMRVSPFRTRTSRRAARRGGQPK